MQLSLSPIPSPEAQHLVLGAVCHVDKPFKPPPLHNGAIHRAQHQTILTHLQEQQVTCGIHTGMHSEALAMNLTGAEGLEIDVVTML